MNRPGKRRSVAPLVLVVLSVLAAVSGLASPGGYTGRTATNSGGCGSCHTTLSGTTTVVLAGPASLAPGTTGSYTCTVTHTPAYSGTNRAGVDIAVKTAPNGSTDAGSLAASGSDLRRSGNELTQSAAKTMSGSPSTTSFAFTWTAPSTAGTYTMQAIGLATNGAKPGVWGWATPLSISVVSLATAEQLVPVVLDVTGENGARFTTELTLTNGGTTDATATLSYVTSALAGNGASGTITRSVVAGRQVVVSDVIAELAAAGIVVARPGDVGTLRVSWSGLSAATAAFSTARTTTASGSGRAGLAYPGLATAELATTRARVFGLRQDVRDRSNLGLVNAGKSGSITLRVTLQSGEAGGPSVVVRDAVTLGPGAWTQLSRLLEGTGITQGWALVERTAGSEPFVAYGAINDNGTGDGSYVAMVPDGRAAQAQLLPVVVETPTFESELVLANPGAAAVTATLTYVPSLDTPSGATPVPVTETLEPGRQKLIPSFLDSLRARGVPVGNRGGSYAGAVRVSFATAGGAAADGFAGARTAAPDGLGGAYGLFAASLPASGLAASEAWVVALSDDASSRSNLALVNADTASSVTLSVEIYDGATGVKAGQLDAITLAPGKWQQTDRILTKASVANGAVRVVRLSGSQAFAAYGVVNDNGTNDGAYVAMAGGK